MSGSIISGNVGGSAFSGAQVQCVNNRTNQILFAAADGSGNFSFTGLIQAKYIISAYFSAEVYYHPVHVAADGTSTFSGINLNPTALNANNAPVQAGNY
jgi:hypothetical protein